jgi:hypothetical protein
MPSTILSSVDMVFEDVVHRHAAGIDVGNEEHYVAIAPHQDEMPVQRLGCFTAELMRMAMWLKERGVQTVAMQSTGVYFALSSALIGRVEVPPALR